MSDQMIRIRWTRGKTNMCEQAPFAVEGRQARYTNNLGDLPEGTFNFTQILLGPSGVKNEGKKACSGEKLNACKARGELTRCAITPLIFGISNSLFLMTVENCNIYCVCKLDV